MSDLWKRVQKGAGVMNRFVAIVWALGGVGSLALAATYNLYFNNTEQGDNSTATPSVSIQQDANGRLVEAKKDPGVLQTPVTEAATPQAVLPAPVATPAPTLTATAPMSAARENKWRFGVLAGMAFEKGVYSNSDSYPNVIYTGVRTTNDYLVDRQTPALILALGYAPLPYLGFNFFAGVGEFPLWGAELEVTPIKINLFGFEDAFELGFMAGGTSLARAHGNAVALHGGVRAGWNFGERWQISANGRANLGFLAADAGISYKF